MKTRKTTITAEQKIAIRAILKGADVTGYALAKTLREIERDHPDLINITPVMGKYDPVGQLPYFGCIATAAGRKAVSGKAA